MSKNKFIKRCGWKAYIKESIIKGIKEYNEAVGGVVLAWWLRRKANNE